MKWFRLAPVLVALTGCMRPTASSPADAADVAELRLRLQAAENGGNPDSMVALMAEDIVMMPPNGAAIVGRAAANEMARGFLGAYNAAVEYTSVEVMVSGDWAFDRGTYKSTLTPKAGGAADSEVGKYVWVSHRGADGTWKFARVIWNPDAPRPA